MRECGTARHPQSRHTGPSPNCRPDPACDSYAVALGGILWAPAFVICDGLGICSRRALASIITCWIQHIT